MLLQGKIVRAPVINVQVRRVLERRRCRSPMRQTQRSDSLGDVDHLEGVEAWGFRSERVRVTRRMMGCEKFSRGTVQSSHADLRTQPTENLSQVYYVMLRVIENKATNCSTERIAQM